MNTPNMSFELGLLVPRLLAFAGGIIGLQLSRGRPLSDLRLSKPFGVATVMRRAPSPAQHPPFRGPVRLCSRPAPSQPYSAAISRAPG